MISVCLSSLAARDVSKGFALLQAHQEPLLAVLDWRENLDKTDAT